MAARLFLVAVIIGSHLGMGALAEEKRAATPERKARILVCFSNQGPARGFNVAWLLHDPLLLADTELDITVAASRRVDGNWHPSVPVDLGRFDLIVVPDGAGSGLMAEDSAPLAAVGGQDVGRKGPQRFQLH